METLPTDWGALMALVFLLGAKHGFDADHLATIDGLTRFNARSNPWLARRCGFFFSLGHGAVVMLIAIVVGAISSHWEVPEWVANTGVWISIGFLTLLGMLNLFSVWRTGPDEVVVPVGLRGRWLGRLQQAGHPGLVALVGALFAISFDTLSQAALFAMTGQQFGGVGHALALGFLFMTGMMVMDGINGLWIARLIRRADATARLASRIMGLAVGGLSLAVAGLGLAKLFSAQIDAWTDGKELLFGLGVVALIGAAYLLAQRMSAAADVAVEQA